jgi:hypothetical protein
MYAYSDYSNGTRVWVADKSGIGEFETIFPEALRSALARYSSLKPNKVGFKAYTADGSRIYALPSASADPPDSFPWDDEFSDYGYQVEYPVDASADRPEYLPDGATDIYIDTGGVRKLRFIANENYSILPPSGAAFRLHYNVRHKMTAGSTGVNTVPDRDYEAFVKIIAANVCYIYVSRLAQNGDSGITDGQRVAQSSASQMRALGDGYMKEAMLLLFPPAENSAPAAKFGEFKESDFNRRQQSVFQKTQSGRKASDF